MNRIALLFMCGGLSLWSFLFGRRVPRPAVPRPEPLDPVQEYACGAARWRWLVLGALAFLAFLVVYWGLFAQVPVDHADTAEHFKYGSIGSDTSAGIPSLIWRVLPDLFPHHLPEPKRYLDLAEAERTTRAAYSQFGFVFEDGHDVPVGMSQRRLGVDLLGLNCAVCHASTVKVSRDMEPSRIYGAGAGALRAGHDRVIILGMPAATFDLGAYLGFLHACARDADFTTEKVLAAIEKKTSLGLVNRYLYRQAVPLMKQRLEDQYRAFAFLRENPPAGPGRVDTFNPYKATVFYLPGDGSVGTADYPSLWNQRPRAGMQLHWDGNNTSVFERNISASLGAGATPVTLDMPRMLRVANWIGSPNPRQPSTAEEVEQERSDPRPRPGELAVPKFPFAIKADLAARGGAVYAAHCASCHDWKGEQIGRVVPLEKIGTDPARLHSYSRELAAGQNTLGAGQWWRFQHFRKTDGYANMPLDGLWARAPYLHNGSVPTLRDLLKAPKDRPPQFYRGDDEYDPKDVGFRSDRDRCDDGRRLFLYSTEPLRDGKPTGNGNGGHTYGSGLSEAEKDALLEYLKTL